MASALLVLVFVCLFALAHTVPLAVDDTVRTGPYPPYPSLEHVMRVANVTDSVVRNLGISQGYFNLTRAYTVFLGSNEGAWSSYAAWASNTVGLGIRNETLPDTLWLELKDKHPLLAEAAKEFPYFRYQIYNNTVAKASSWLGEGNQVVWAQVGSGMSQLLTLFGSDTERNDTKFEAFYNTFNPNMPPEGELLLAKGLRAYYNARWTTDATQKSQYIALGNAYIGWDEQTTLQEALNGVFAPVALPLPKKLGGATLEIPVETAMDDIFTYNLPGECLSVHRDVPVNLDGSMFPAGLQQITEPDLVHAYLHFLAPLDGLKGTQTYAWVSLEQRMRWVIIMMRTRQADDSLWRCPPFTPSQMADIDKLSFPTDGDFCIIDCKCTLPVP